MDIDTGDSLPSAKKTLHTTPSNTMTGVQQEIKSLEWAGIITRSVSLWASPIIVIPKKSAPGEAPGGECALTFHAINALQPKVVKADSKAKGNFNPPSTSKHWSALWTASRSQSILYPRFKEWLLSHQTRKGLPCKDIFCHPHLVSMNSTWFHLDWHKAPLTFRHSSVRSWMGSTCLQWAYLDDIIIFSRNEAEHLGTSQDHLPETRRSQIEAQVIQMQLHKETHTISWSSYITGRNTVLSPEKLESIRKHATTQESKQSKQFLGLAGYYHKFVPRFSDLSRPPHQAKPGRMFYSNGPRNVKQYSKCSRTLCVNIPYYGYPDPAKTLHAFSQMQASMLGQEY